MGRNHKKQGITMRIVIVENVINGLYWGFLIAAAIQDFFRKKVDLWIFVVFGLLIAVGKGYLCMVEKEEFLWKDTTAGAGIGILLMGMAAASRGGIGMGDGCFFCISGLALGFWKNAVIFCVSVLICGTWSLFLMAKNHFSGRTCGRLRKKTVPFLPFVLAAAVCVEIGGSL